MRPLTDQPVEACPPSTTYRLREFVRELRCPVHRDDGHGRPDGKH